MMPSNTPLRRQERYHPRVDANWMVKAHLGEREARAAVASARRGR